MNLVRNTIVWWRGALALVCGLLLTGCVTTETDKPGGEKGAAARINIPDRIRTGERLEIEFLDIGAPQKIEQTVQQDGSITLILGQTANVAGKTLADAQKEIQDIYIKGNLFKRLTVNIKREVRFFYVGGEVRKPGPQPYLGDTTVVMAIQAAGDFTVYAKKKAVQLTRTDGKMEIINVPDAIKNPKKDVPIYPGDRIFVPLSPY
jgi:polysaccharide biosynthesis/export protein VpsN